MSETESNNVNAPTLIGLSRSSFNIVAYGVIQYLKGKTFLRTVIFISGLLSLILAIVVYLNLLPMPSVQLAGKIGFFITGGLLLWMAVVSGSNFRVYIREDQATRERITAEEQFENSPNPSAALELDTKRLNEYYTINQGQARSSFRWAVFAMLSGLGTIIAGIWFFYLRQGLQDTFMTSLSTAAGLVVNAISGLFLYMHNKTKEQSVYYYDRLVRLQHISIAIQLAGTHGSEKAREDSTNKVIEYLLQSSELQNKVDTNEA